RGFNSSNSQGGAYNVQTEQSPRQEFADGQGQEAHVIANITGLYQGHGSNSRGQMMTGEVPSQPGAYLVLYSMIDTTNSFNEYGVEHSNTNLTEQIQGQAPQVSQEPVAQNQAVTQNQERVHSPQTIV
ncbi:hypothetical protein HAX54_040346, partial [Datura stramonium]|nr:hypothetical protein [Datura stramonium]